MKISTDGTFERGEARILVIDDEPSNLKLLNSTLRLEGYGSIDLLDDPARALDQYRQAPPDLILLDLNMPGLSGFDILEQLTGLQDPMLPPIVVLTAQSDEASRVRALQSGASDFLTKPFGRRELLARVHNMLLVQAGRSAMRDRNRALELQVAARTRELRQSRLEIVQRLGRASAMRDDETGRHILRMSRSSALLARSVGWSAAQCELMLNASPMHDIGKIGIPDAILLKPGSLSPQEVEVMRSHTTIGGQLLGDSDDPLLTQARDIALAHHEHWDGNGYPAGLRGTEIPESARIVAIADVFDALLSNRPYKKAWSVEQATGHLRERSGSQFEPRLVDAFLSILPRVLQVRERHADPVPPAHGVGTPDQRTGEAPPVREAAEASDS